MKLLPPCLLLAALIGAAPAAAQSATSAETADPYRMVRSLQVVQDQVVLGDHSAADMQRFMLGTIDQRLKSAPSAVFEDPRNVDAALIYAMSGGNPSTLEYLVSHDIGGHFDNRVTDALRKYLNGKGTLVVKTLADMLPEYRDAKIGPYLALVAANVSVSTNADQALKFYDWARLTAPGTIIEEAALRRSMMLCLDSGKTDKALHYSISYIRRFLHSPYASQFADLFVRLIVENYDALPADDVASALSFMDQDRQRETYLRVARAAAIAGKNELARLAAENAKRLSEEDGGAGGQLADLYGGVADVPTPGVGAAATVISEIPDTALSPSDRALRDAARAVATAVVTPPMPLSAPPEPPPANGDTQQDPTAKPARSVVPQAAVAAKAPQAVPASANAGPAAEPEAAIDPTLKSFLDTGRSKLDAIDNLLKTEGASK